MEKTKICRKRQGKLGKDLEEKKGGGGSGRGSGGVKDLVKVGVWGEVAIDGGHKKRGELIGYGNINWLVYWRKRGSFKV